MKLGIGGRRGSKCAGWIDSISLQWPTKTGRFFCLSLDNTDHIYLVALESTVPMAGITFCILSQSIP